MDSAPSKFTDVLTDAAKRKEFVNRNRLNIIIYTCAVVAVLFVYHLLSDGDFSFLLTLGGLARLFGFCFLLIKMQSERNASGVSLKTLEVYVLVFLGRLCSIMFYEGYLPYDSSGDWLYTAVEFLSLSVVLALIFLTLVTFSSTYNVAEDGFGKTSAIPSQFGPILLVVPAFVLAVLFHPSLNRNVVTDIAWTFALYLETAAIMPQFYMLQKANRAVEAWVSHFVFAIGMSRVFLTIFWASSYHELSDSHSIGITGGWAGRMVLLCQLIHLAVMAEFCYHYIRASVDQSPLVLPGMQV